MKRILHVALALRHFEKNSFFMGGGEGGAGGRFSGAFTLPCLRTKEGVSKEIGGLVRLPV